MDALLLSVIQKHITINRFFCVKQISTPGKCISQGYIFIKRGRQKGLEER